MPGRAIYALVAGLVAAAALGLLVSAGRDAGTHPAATRSTTSSGGTRSYTLRLYTDTLAARHIDLPPAGRSRGDEAILRIPLHNDRSVAEGSMNVTCTARSKRVDAPSHCYGLINLSSGTIVVAGNDGPNYPIVRFGIVGGTGAYDNEAGEVVGYPASGGVTVDIELRHAQGTTSRAATGPSGQFHGTWWAIDPADGSLEQMTFGTGGSVVIRDTSAIDCGGVPLVVRDVGTVSGDIWTGSGKAIAVCPSTKQKIGPLFFQVTADTNGTLLWNFSGEVWTRTQP